MQLPCSDTAGTLFFADDNLSVQSSRLDADSSKKSGYQVEVKTLDQMVEEMQLPRVDFIKCDAEGVEIGILRGATKTLRKFKPKLAFCAYHNPTDFDQMRAILRPLGYRIKGKGLVNGGDGIVVVMLHAW